MKNQIKLLSVVVDNLINQAISLNKHKSIVFPKTFWVDYDKDLSVVRVSMKLKESINEVLTTRGLTYELNDYGIAVTIDFDKVALTNEQYQALETSKLLRS